MYVCVCNAVTDGDINSAVAAGCCTLRHLRERLGVGACCGRCASCARTLLKETLHTHTHHQAATLQYAAT